LGKKLAIIASHAIIPMAAFSFQSEITIVFPQSCVYFSNKCKHFSDIPNGSREKW